MSRFFQTCEAIKALLEASPALVGFAVMVDRQRDILAELQKTQAKHSGRGLLVVSWAGSPNAEENSDRPCFDSRYLITGFFKPTIRQGDTAADEIIEAAALAVHDQPKQANEACQHYLKIMGVEPISHPDLLIYQIKLRTTDNV